MRTKLAPVVAVALGINALGLLASPVRAAAAFTVNTGADEPDQFPGDGVCASAAGNCTLRAAVQESAQESATAIVYLPYTQVYALQRDGADGDTADGSKGDLDVTAGNITIQGYGGLTPLSASAIHDRIFDVSFGATLILKSVRLAGGSAPNGGAIRNAGTLNVTSSVFVYNSSTDSGGAIWNGLGRVSISKSTLAENVAQGNGGAIFSQAGVLAVTASSIDSNSAWVDGGGIFNRHNDLNVLQTAVTDNRAGGLGGGIATSLSSAVDVVRSQITFNSASQGGGGFYNCCDNGYRIRLDQDTVAHNFAPDGAGLYNTNLAIDPSKGGSPNLGSVIMSSSTISSNQATRNGGGIWNGATTSLFDTTVAANTADSDANGIGEGGGIFTTSGSVSLKNTIVGTNADLTARAPDCFGALTSGGYNLVQRTGGCLIQGDGTGNIVGRDPKLAPLAYNGSDIVETHALLANLSLTQSPSPAIDTGGGCLFEDERSQSRPYDGNGDGIARCDIGAYELHGSITLGTFQLTPVALETRAGQPISYEVSWTVPAGGWRALDSVEVRFIDEIDGDGFWLRFHDVAGSLGTLACVDLQTGRSGPQFDPGSPNRLESNIATLLLASSRVIGPPGTTITIDFNLVFKPTEANRTLKVEVLASSDSGAAQGFIRAGSVTVLGDR